MIKKILKLIGVVIPFVIHFSIMSAILIIALVNIKYGIEFELIGTGHSQRVNDVYEMVYSLYLGSIISFAVIHFFYLIISRWFRNKNKVVR
jgi:hypothetical protein